MLRVEVVCHGVFLVVYKIVFGDLEIALRCCAYLAYARRCSPLREAGRSAHWRGTSCAYESDPLFSQ